MEDLKKDRVFYYFSKIMEIPRPSGHEKEISDFLVATGKKLGLETYQDENLNVILKKDASKGYENAPKIAIQGHMDMVGARSDDSDHDFLKDPIKANVDGKYLKAKDTTLGADNGIAIAMGLSLLEDYKGPAIELLITTEEETSMNGALSLSDDILEADYLINLDSEEEGILTVGSAGGITVFVSEGIKNEEKEDCFEVKISGLLGGHSGMDINLNRSNALKVISYFLENLGDNIRLGEISSGSLDNVIPSSGSVKIFNSKEESLKKSKQKTLDKFYNVDGNLKIDIKKDKAYSYNKELSDKIRTLIKEIPTGVNSFMGDEKTVESSDNLAFVKEEDGQIKCEISIRSSDEDKLDTLKNEVCEKLDNIGLSYKLGSAYPGWEYNEDSKLRPLAQKLYKKLYKDEFETIVIHAGLECGAIYEKYPDLDIISIGPNIIGAHSTDERLDIKSTKRVYEYLKELIKEIK